MTTSREKKTVRAWVLIFILLLPIAAGADGWSLIMTGVTWHAGDGPQARRALNAWQHTAGLDYTVGPWFVQASHMTDSYYCSSTEAVAGRRLRLIEGAAWDTGVFGAATLVSRCAQYDYWGRDRLDHRSFVRARYLGPLVGAYVRLGSRVRVEALLLPTVAWCRCLNDNTPLVYAQLEVQL